MRQREFVADASHELQSPLASLRAQLEVSLAHPDGVDWTALAADLLDDTRPDGAAGPRLAVPRPGRRRSCRPRRRWSDLDLLVVRGGARLRARTRVGLDLTAVAPTPVDGDAEDLRRLIRNLLDNAVGHASARSRSNCATSRMGCVLSSATTARGSLPTTGPESSSVSSGWTALACEVRAARASACPSR